MSGCPWTLSLSLSVVRCRLSRKHDNDDLVGMQLNVSHESGSFLNASTVDVFITDHPGQVGVHLVEESRDLPKPLVDGIQPGRHCCAVIDDRFVQLGWGATAQHGGEVLGMPTQCER